MGCDYWSDEEGFLAAINKTRITGICGSGIIEVMAELFLAGVIQSDGVINGDKSKLSSRIVKNGKTWSYQLVDVQLAKLNSQNVPRKNNLNESATVVITQNDVRAIQLAKATLYASVKLLMDKLKTDRLDRICFAGAFGSHIDPFYAMLLGLIPDCPLEEVVSVGNAAGTGARIALSCINARREIEAEVVKMEKIETATESNFQEYFINAMAIPHALDKFENLEKKITLPIKKTGSQI
ncbi:MAG: ASKHA domain-containing protein [Enterobacterales bacterium]|nr:ASKHA domain-containing protein [Enterobacterales bacterium]